MNKTLFYSILLGIAIFNLILALLLFNSISQSQPINCLNIDIKNTYLCIPKLPIYVLLAFGALLGNIMFFKRKIWIKN